SVCSGRKLLSTPSGSERPKIAKILSRDQLPACSACHGRYPKCLVLGGKRLVRAPVSPVVPEARETSSCQLNSEPAFPNSGEISAYFTIPIIFELFEDDLGMRVVGI